MGPYCNFCGKRCFCHFPQDTPHYILKAYGRATIVASCPKGQALEKQEVGFCLEDIKLIALDDLLLENLPETTGPRTERSEISLEVKYD